MNRDFVEMLAALSDAEAHFLVVGVHAMAVHGRPRATGDLDLWVRPSAENARRVWAALEAFGAPLDKLEPEDLSRSIRRCYPAGRASPASATSTSSARWIAR